MTNATEFQIEGVTLVVYYDRTSRAWWGFYVDQNGDQIGEAWNNVSRDYLLLTRPAVPVAV